MTSAAATLPRFADGPSRLTKYTCRSFVGASNSSRSASTPLPSTSSTTSPRGVPAAVHRPLRPLSLASVVTMAAPAARSSAMASTHSRDSMSAARPWSLKPTSLTTVNSCASRATQRAFSALPMPIVPLETSTCVAPKPWHSSAKSGTSPSIAKRSNSVPPK